MAARSLSLAYLPSVFHHMKMELVDILRWNKVLQNLMSPLGIDLRAKQAKSSGHSKDVGVDRHSGPS
jgi:hypothetical protein